MFYVRLDRCWTWSFYLELLCRTVLILHLFSVVCSAFSSPKPKWDMIISSYSSKTFTEVLRIPALKHVVLKAWCKAETAAEIMTVRSVVSCSNTMPISLFLSNNPRLGLCLQGSFSFWQLEWCWEIQWRKPLIQWQNIDTQKSGIEADEAAIVFNKRLQLGDLSLQDLHARPLWHLP